MSDAQQAEQPFDEWLDDRKARYAGMLPQTPQDRDIRRFIRELERLQQENERLRAHTRELNERIDVFQQQLRFERGEVEKQPGNR